MQKRVSSMPINIESPRPRSALLRGIHITEFKGHVINPDPIILQETDLLLEEFLSPTKLKALTGADDLNSVEFLEMIVDTSETSLGNFGIYLPNLRQLKLNGSHVPRIRDLGTSLAHLTVLWLSRSGLVDLDGVATLNSLKELYLAYNDINDISPCSLLEKLTCLDLEGNLIDDLKQVEFLNLCPQLTYLTLYGNPICSKPSPDSDDNITDYSYRHEVIKILPSLRTLDDELTLNTNPKSPTRTLKSSSNHSCPFDNDWQLINKIFDEGIGPSEEKLAINESMRPGTGSSSSGGRRPATGVRPLTAMRPLSSYRMKTSSAQMRRPNSRQSLNSSSSSRMSASPPQSSSSNTNNSFGQTESIFDTPSDASQLTVGPTFQGNPMKSLLARKKNNASFFTIQTNSDHCKLANSWKTKTDLDESLKAKQVSLENRALKEELDNWRREHARRMEERKSYFEPQVLVIDDDPVITDNCSDLEVVDDSNNEPVKQSRPKSKFKSSFDYDETISADFESLQIDEDRSKKKKEHRHRHRHSSRSKSKSRRSDEPIPTQPKSTEKNHHHQPIIVSNSGQVPSSPPMAIIKSLKPSLILSQPANGLTSLRQLKTNITALPEIKLPK